MLKLKSLANNILTTKESATLALNARVKKLQKQGKKIFNLTAGEPDFFPPKKVLLAGKKALATGKTKYTPSIGISELRKAIAQKLKKDQGLKYTIDQIAVTNGAKHAVFNTLFVLLKPKDEVIILSPYWLSYPAMIKLVGGKIKVVSADHQFHPNPQKISQSISRKTKAIILNSPNNPTGAVYTKEELQEIANLAKKYNLWIISDEVYEKFVFEGQHCSCAQLGKDAYQRTMVINGVSKSHAMTGLRIGYLAGDKNIVAAVAKLQSHSTSNPASVSQYAALEALQSDLSAKMLREFLKRRNLIVKMLTPLKSVKLIPPQGAFYALIDVSKINRNSEEFCEGLLQKKGVALVPGKDFGKEGWVRLSFALDTYLLKEALKRFSDFVINPVRSSLLKSISSPD